LELSVREVAKLLGVSEEAVYRLAEHDGLPVQHIGEELRVNRSELLEWATAHRISVGAELFAPESSTQLPTLADSLAAGGVVHDLPGATKAEVLEALVQAMTLPEGTDRAALLSVLEAREALGSTGIGDGIAIPHPRNPIVLRVRRPIVTLCFLATPVDFAALDGKPVFALFSLISPTPKLHLHLLSRLAYVLRDAVCRAAIALRGDAGTILGEIRRVEAGLVKK
jgi:PTS system nitrogen regulatory IIA component